MPSTPPASPVASHDGQSSASLCALALIALLTAAAPGRTTRRGALIALTLWMGFQAGAHSVHHLGQPTDEARCAIASHASQGPGLVPDTSQSADILWPATWTDLHQVRAALRSGPETPHDGRAPPAPLT
jgi:hypothetical protein